MKTKDRRERYQQIADRFSVAGELAVNAQKDFAGSNYKPGEFDQFDRFLDLMALASLELRWLLEQTKDHRRK